MRATWLSALVAAATLSCVGLEPLEGRRCDCAPGFVCCPALDICVRPEMRAGLACELDGASAADSDSASDLAPPDVSPDGGPGDVDPDLAPDLAPEGPEECPGAGVQAIYYNDLGWKDAVVRRIEPGFSHYWREGAPTSLVREDLFSAVLSATLTPDQDDDYTFLLNGDDGARLWIDGEVVLDKFARELRFPLASTRKLQKGKRYQVMVETFDMEGPAMVELEWHRPGIGQGRIPQCLLTPSEAVPSHCSRWGDDCVPPETPPCGNGNGLVARYFSDPQRTVQVAESQHSPLSLSLYPPPDTKGPLYATYLGQLEVPVSETYTFYLLNDHVAELYIDDQQVGSNTDEGTSPESILTMHLAAGLHPIRVDWDIGNYPSAFIQLRWSSTSVPKGPVSSCRYHAPAPGAVASPDAGPADAADPED